MNQTQVSEKALHVAAILERFAAAVTSAEVFNEDAGTSYYTDLQAIEDQVYDEIICLESNEDGKEYECQNCGGRYTAEEIVDFENITDLLSRIAPGETVPYGECPDKDCGAFVYLIRKEDD
jgi:hypothetical protein